MLFSDEPHVTSQSMIERALRATLRKDSPVPVEIYSEYMDVLRASAVDYENEMIRLLRHKEKKFDAIFAIGHQALQLLVRNRPGLFRDSPIVFLTLDGRTTAGLDFGPNVTGVWGEINFKPNLELALTLHPGTERVVVIAGVSEWDKSWLALAREDFHQYESSLEFTYLTGLTSAELRNALTGLPPHTIVSYLTSVQDKTGNRYDNIDLLNLICPGSGAPIYGTTDAQIGAGIVGGRLLSYEALGFGGAQVGLRVLAGEKPEAIAPHGIPSVAMFDWRQLKRWGISDKSLPPESLLRFRVPSFWDEYKWYAIAVACVVMIQSLLITGLVIHRARRRRAERALGRSEQRNRDIVRAQPDLLFVNSPDGVFLDYHVHDKSDLLISPEEFLGKNLCDVLPSELAGAYLDCFRRAKQSGELQVVEYTLPLHGEMRSYEARVIYTDADQFLTIVRDVTERKRADEAVRESQAQLAGIIGSAMDAIISIGDSRRIILFNSAAERVFGCSAQEAVGQLIDRFIPERFRSAHIRHIEAFGSAEETSRSVVGLYGLRANGEEFPIESSISQIELHGQKFYTVILRDVTKRRQALEELRESEARFRNMADTAPVMIWVSDANNLCTYVNKQWLDFTGRSLEEELGDTWTAGIHPDDIDRCLHTYKRASERHQPFTMEYRLRRADEQFRWVLDSGAPRLSPNAKFLGYIGSCIDITERKVAEEALQDLSGQLIQAREDECARIARDLHDDLNQRVAIISLELDRLRLNPRETHAKLCEVVDEILTHAAGLSEEIHRMSHDLHPSKLEHLGLVAALKSLCVELSENYGLRIKFRHADVPSLSKGVSMCLYRIAQESLNNVIKHSGAKEAVVELRGSEQEMQLRVLDLGRGFDTESPGIKKGLGLVSMRERLRLVGGHITINSRPSHGTQVEARVPIESKTVGLRCVQREEAPAVSKHRETPRAREASSR